jgi:deazaflavin-dependent oxidoreductase (nitroreductase family)
LNLQKRLKRGFLTFIKYTLNPLTRRLGRLPFGPISLVQHVGRRSGKQYETPIMARPVEGGFVIELTYGYDVDWHKNVLAAGGCTLIHHGKAYSINHIEPIDMETGLAAFSPVQRFLLRLLKRRHFEILRVKS